MKIEKKDHRKLCNKEKEKNGKNRGCTRQERIIKLGSYNLFPAIKTDKNKK